MADKKPKITIDTNVINSKQRLAAMNMLERWRDEGKIVIVGTTRLKFEVGAYKNAKASEKEKNIPNVGEPLVLGKSYLGHAYLAGPKPNAPQFWDLSKIMFPGKDHEKLDNNQSNDVMHLMSHFFAASDIFVTNNTKDFINDGRREKLKAAFQITVMTAEEAVTDLSAKHGWS